LNTLSAIHGDAGVFLDLAEKPTGTTYFFKVLLVAFFAGFFAGFLAAFSPVPWPPGPPSRRKEWCDAAFSAASHCLALRRGRGTVEAFMLS